MNIEVGKYYRTRDGRKAYVAARHPTNGQFIGWIDGEDDWRIWHADRRDFDWSAYEIVAEWREPREVQAWVYLVDRLGYRNLFLSLLPGDGKILGKVLVTVKEGEGMDG